MAREWIGFASWGNMYVLTNYVPQRPVQKWIMGFLSSSHYFLALLQVSQIASKTFSDLKVANCSCSVAHDSSSRCLRTSSYFLYNIPTFTDRILLPTGYHFVFPHPHTPFIYFNQSKEDLLNQRRPQLLGFSNNVWVQCFLPHLLENSYLKPRQMLLLSVL